jgi:hypothetical protein
MQPENSGCVLFILRGFGESGELQAGRRGENARVYYYGGSSI